MLRLTCRVCGATLHILLLMPRNLELWCRFTVPASLEAQYTIYHDLETSEARILLPSKVRQFPVLRADAAATSGTPNPELLPSCVGVDEVRPTLLNSQHMHATKHK